MKRRDTKWDQIHIMQISYYGKYFLFMFYIMKIEELNLQSLRDLAKSKKGHPGLRGFSTMKKGDLAAALKKNFKIKGGALEERAGSCQAVGSGRTGDPFKAMKAALKAKSGPKVKKTKTTKKEEKKEEEEQPIGDLEEFDTQPTQPMRFYPELGIKKKLTESQAKYFAEMKREQESEGSGIRHHVQRVLDGIKKIKSMRAKGGQISEKVKDMAQSIDVAGKGVGDDDDDIDFDDIKWGKFTDQLDRYNSQNKKNISLCQFADLILRNPKKYTVTTQRRARFYKNVLAKKKCS